MWSLPPRASPPGNWPRRSPPTAPGRLKGQLVTLFGLPRTGMGGRRTGRAPAQPLVQRDRPAVTRVHIQNGAAVPRRPILAYCALTADLFGPAVADWNRLGYCAAVETK